MAQIRQHKVTGSIEGVEGKYVAVDADFDLVEVLALPTNLAELRVDNGVLRPETPQERAIREGRPRTKTLDEEIAELKQRVAAIESKEVIRG